MAAGRDFVLPLRCRADIEAALGDRMLERAIGVIYRPETERMAGSRVWVQRLGSDQRAAAVSAIVSPINAVSAGVVPGAMVPVSAHVPGSAPVSMSAAPVRFLSSAPPHAASITAVSEPRIQDARIMSITPVHDCPNSNPW